MNQYVTWLPEDGIIDEVAIDRVCRDRDYARLTRREAILVVERLTAGGDSASEIAELLRVGQKTVERMRDKVLVAA